MVDNPSPRIEVCLELVKIEKWTALALQDLFEIDNKFYFQSDGPSLFLSLTQICLSSDA
jgi:hypothetical protein